MLIDNESFMMLPNGIQYTRIWMQKVIGQEMVDAMFEFSDMFNQLHFTAKEVALLFPYALTVYGKYLNIVDYIIIKKL